MTENTPSSLNIPIQQSTSSPLSKEPYSIIQSSSKGDAVAREILAPSEDQGSTELTSSYSSDSDDSCLSVSSADLPYTEESKPLSEQISKIVSMTQVRATSRVLKEKPASLFTHKTSGKYRALSKPLKESLGGKNYQIVMKQIQQFGPAHLAEAIEKNQTKEVSLTTGHKILYKPSGKAYLKMGSLGVGLHKETEKYVIIASPIITHLAKEHLVFRAYASPLPQTYGEEISDEQKIKNENKLRRGNEREKQINQVLKLASKEPDIDLSHVNIIKSVTTTESGLSVTMAEVFEGDVEHLIHPSTSEKEKWNTAAQMTKGVCQLSSVNVRHGDIHPGNFLYKHDAEGRLVVKITDFGLSSMTQGPMRYARSAFLKILSDPLWKDVPTTDDIYVSEASEVYQLGHALCMTLTGLSVKQYNESLQHDIQKQRLSSLESWKLYPENWSALNSITDESTKQFLLQMLNPYPTQENPRPTLAEVLAFAEAKFAGFN